MKLAVGIETEAMQKTKLFGPLDEIVAPTPVWKQFSPRITVLSSGNSKRARLTRSTPDDADFSVGSELVTIFAKANDLTKSMSDVPIRATNPVPRNDRFESLFDAQLFCEVVSRKVQQPCEHKLTVKRRSLSCPSFGSPLLSDARGFFSASGFLPPVEACAFSNAIGAGPIH